MDIVREEIIKINNSKNISSLNQVIIRVLHFLLALPIPFSSQISQVIYESIKIAAELGDSFVCSEHLLLSLLSINDEINLKIIKDLNINTNELKQQTLLAIQSRQGLRN